MPLNPNFFVTLSLEEIFMDKTTGTPLAGGFIYFYSDNSRGDAKPVYQITGSPPNYEYIQLPNPVELGVDGAPQNDSDQNVAMYYYPYDDQGNLELYYIVVYNSNMQEQFTREGWPNVTSSEEVNNSDNNFNNQISNSQFSDILFDESIGFTISWSGEIAGAVYPIAPGWDMVVSASASGSITVNRTAITGASNLVTNPPFALDVLPSGASISSIVLRQRFNNNPGIWATTAEEAGYVNGGLLCSSLDGGSHTIIMQLAESVESSPTTILSISTGTSGYNFFSETVELPLSQNSDDGDTGYTDILITLPSTGHVNISSIQLLGINSAIESIPYQQDSVDRQQDHLFHYYNPLLQFKPIPGFLVGWDFPINPQQFTGTTGLTGGDSQYITDGTILFQSATTDIVTSFDARGNIVLTPPDTTQVALIQYVADHQYSINQILNNPLSVNIRGCTSVTGGLKGTVSLYYCNDATLPDLNSPTYESLVSSLSADGKPTGFNGSWTEIARGNLGDAIFTLPQGDSASVTADISFSGWEPLSTADYPETAPYYFAIVIGFASLTGTESISFADINLCPGYIATRSAPKTLLQSLKECEAFFEKTWPVGTPVGTDDVPNAIFKVVGGLSQTNVESVSFSIPFKTEKVFIPNITLYSSTGVIDKISVGGFASASNSYPAPISGSNPNLTVSPGDFWSFTSPFTNIGKNEAFLFSLNQNDIMNFSVTNIQECHFYFHYTLDSRPGIIT